jgi:hypothetical protein
MMLCRSDYFLTNIADGDIPIIYRALFRTRAGVFASRARARSFAALCVAAGLLCLVAGQGVGAASLADHSFQSSIVKSPFGHTTGGVAVELYTLRNRHGMEARIATYGGIVTTLTAPDRDGHYADVVLGYDSLAGYLKSSPYFGALIDR